MELGILPIIFVNKKNSFYIKLVFLIKLNITRLMITLKKSLPDAFKCYALTESEC